MQKYIEAVKAKQEKVDPIEALELNDEIAFWEGVKGILAERNGAVADTAAAAAPVAENEMQPVEVVSAHTAEEIADAQAFMAAEQANTVDAYQKYLDDYPNGAYRDGARAGVWKIEGINPESYNDLENERSAAAKVLQDNIAQPVNGDVVAPVADEDVNAVGNADTAVDNQGNPIDANGKLIVDGVTSIDEITDEDFENPTRNVQLPALPENVANAIGTEGRPVVIKKNVFEKNNKTHVELEPENSRDILRSALYNPDIVGSTQPIKRPDYKVAIRTGEKNAIVVLDVYRGKDYVEIVGWRMINEKGLAKMQRQAEREGGQFLILSPNEGSAAALSALPLGQSSTSEDTTPTADVQEIAQESGENAVNGGEISSSETADSSTVPEGTSAPGQNAVPKKKRRKSPTTPQEVAQEALAQAEENRRKPLRARAQEWQQKLGVQVNVIESVDEVKNSAALQAINEGERVAGWFSGGKVYVYMPGIEDMADLDKTVVHEVVAHKGLKSLMGDKFDVLCDKVWESMGKEAREKFLRYVNAKNIDTPSVAEMRAAADEYMAYIAEGVDLTDADRTVWQKVVEFFREFLESLGAKLTDKDIENLIKASYANLRNTAGKTAEKKVESRTMFRIAEVNERFNERLLELDKDRTQKDRVLRLGRPSEFLKNAGIIDADIEMEFDKFVKKSSEDYENDHPFTAEDIMDLPKAIYAPIAVFNSTNNRDKVILTELKKDGKNFIVAIKAVERRRKGGVVLEVNEIATLYPKNAKGILSWINNGLIANVDKEKTLDWLEALRTNRGTGLNNQELSDAANVINNFENPSIDSENSADTRFRIANRSQEVFVSNARKAVEEIKQEKATPQQWLAMLKKNGGLKAGEDAWMGLSEWLENSEAKSLTKQEVLGFIDENAIKIEEVEYRDDASDNYAGTTGFLRAVEEQLEEDARYHAESEMYPDEFENEEDYLYAIRSAIREYKEDPTGVHYDIAAEKVVRRGDGPNLINSTRLDYTTEGLENKREIALTVPTIEPYNESDEVHFGDAGGGRAVAWVRFGETTDSEGNRVLVIDEIQSKRHQDGREKGYEKTDANDAFETYRDKMMEKYNLPSDQIYKILANEEKEEFDRLRTAANEEFRTSSDVPSAPFEKNWQELAMKRMLRLAAEEGFDKVAWTTGEQQAERYDMSNVISEIAYWKEGDKYGISAGNYEYSQVIDQQIYSYDELVQTFGKKIADDIANDAGKEESVLGYPEDPNVRYINGEEIKIGGEGMKGFYDRILPSFVSKYTKKWGAKVGTVEMPYLEQNNTMWSVDITPEMQESVMEGQTMFRFIGERGAANLDRAEEATTRLDNLAVAREMEAAGKEAKAVKLATGWERGADGKWRYETEDIVINNDALLMDLASYDEFALSELEDGRIAVDCTVRLQDLVADNELFKAYPSLKRYYVTFEQMEDNTLGSHDGEGQVIRVNRNRLGLNEDEEGRSVRSTLVHEIQHAIQAIEGFAQGGSSDMVIPETNEQLGKSGYNRLAGEVESRNVQKRMDYTEEQRRNELAVETEDVSREDQIFIYDSLGVSEMGSREDKRIAKIAKHFSGARLTDNQQAIIDVFSGTQDNLPITVNRNDGTTHKVIIRQGKADKLGAKHSIVRHFGDMHTGSYTAEELLLIEDVLANGERKESVRRGVKVKEYNLPKDGVVYTVVTEKNNRGAEVFGNFYTNRSGNTRSSNTQLSAQADSITASEDKGSDNSSNSQEDSGTRLRISQEELRREVQRVDSEIVSAVNNAAAGLNTGVEIVSDIQDVPDARRRGSKGWFSNGKVYLVLPNAEGVEDAVETVLHEVVGHKGLRRLFGGKFDEMLSEVFGSAPKNVRAEIMRRALELMRRGRKNFLHEAVEENLTPKIFPLSRPYNGGFRQRKQTTERKVIKGSIATQ